MNNKLKIIELLLILFACERIHAMQKPETAISTHQALNDRLTQAVRHAFGNDAATLECLQGIQRDLETRQNAWQYGVVNNKLCYVINAQDEPPVANDVVLWQTLSDVVSALHEHLDLDIEILCSQCTLLYALVSKGLSVELLRTAEFSRNRSTSTQAVEIQKQFGKPSAYLIKKAQTIPHWHTRVDIEYYERLTVEHRQALKAHLENKSK